MTGPGLPFAAAGAYVAVAYLIFAAVVTVYVAILSTRLSRTRRELETRGREPEGTPR